MRAVIQRCLSANVEVEGKVVGDIQKGFVVFKTSIHGIKHRLGYAAVTLGRDAHVLINFGVILGCHGSIIVGADGKDTLGYLCHTPDHGGKILVSHDSRQEVDTFAVKVLLDTLYRGVNALGVVSTVGDDQRLFA